MMSKTVKKVQKMWSGVRRTCYSYFEICSESKQINNLKNALWDITISFPLCRMWQNSPESSRSPWVQMLKNVMKKPVSDPPKSVEMDAETEILGRVSSPESPSGSSCGIPDNFFGVVDEPELPSQDEVGYLFVSEHQCTWQVLNVNCCSDIV